MSRFDTVEHWFKLFPAVVLWFSAQTHILRHISLILSHSWCHKIICLSYFKRKIKSSNLFSHNTFCNNAFFSYFLSKLSFTATQFLLEHTETIVLHSGQMSRLLYNSNWYHTSVDYRHYFNLTIYGHIYRSILYLLHSQY